MGVLMMALQSRRSIKKVVGSSGSGSEVDSLTCAFLGAGVSTTCDTFPVCGATGEWCNKLLVDDLTESLTALALFFADDKRGVTGLPRSDLLTWVYPVTQHIMINMSMIPFCTLNYSFTLIVYLPLIIA